MNAYPYTQIEPIPVRGLAEITFNRRIGTSRCPTCHGVGMVHCPSRREGQKGTRCVCPTCRGEKRT